MKINLNAIDVNQFMVHPYVLNGQKVFLVQPQNIGCKWTQANKIFRSSLWDSEGNLISAGFPKFTNWGENLEHFPVPNSLVNTNVVEKLDGSLLIVAKWRGQYILRTRGTVDATKLDNGYELELFKQTILPMLEAECGKSDDTWNVSFLFEWVSPNRRIILDYGNTPQWFFVGQVQHKDYSLTSQETLNVIAQRQQLLRPPTYNFPSITELMANVEMWKGKEGVVVYSKFDQVLHKVKGIWYLALCRMKESLSSFDKVVDVWFEQGQPNYVEFEKFIISQFDWELWQQIRGDASRICDANKKVDQIIAGMQKFVDEKLKPLPTRRDQAQIVFASYGNTNRASFVFKLLDNKILDVKDRKKLLYQLLK